MSLNLALVHYGTDTLVHYGKDANTCEVAVCILAGRFVLLASGLGLGLGGSGADSLLSLQLLVDMVSGQLGDQGEQSGAARICRVLLAGNLLSHSTQDRDSVNKVSSLGGLRSGTPAVWAEVQHVLRVANRNTE